MRLLLQSFNILSLLPTLLAQTSNSDQWVLDASSFIMSLANSPTWSSQLDFLATNPALANNPAVETALNDVNPFFIATLSDPTAFFAAAVAAVPAPAQPIFSSVFSDMLSIASKDGITGTGTSMSALSTYGYNLSTITAPGGGPATTAAVVTSGSSSAVTFVPTGPSNLSASSSTLLGSGGSTLLSSGGSTMTSTPSVTNAAVSSGTTTAPSVAPTATSQNMAASHTMLAGGVVAGVAAFAMLL